MLTRTGFQEHKSLIYPTFPQNQSAEQTRSPDPACCNPDASVSLSPGSRDTTDPWMHPWRDNQVLDRVPALGQGNQSSRVLNTVRHSNLGRIPLPTAKPKVEVKVSNGKTA